MKVYKSVRRIAHIPDPRGRKLNVQDFLSKQVVLDFSVFWLQHDLHVKKLSKEHSLAPKDLFCAVKQPGMAEIAENNESVDDRFVAGLTPEEEKEMAVKLEKMKLETEESTEMPKFPDYPLYDRVKELKLDEYPEEETEFYKDLEGKPNDFYTKMKDMPDSLAKKYYPDMCRRFIGCEKRIKHMEEILWKLPREDKSMEEDRFEILGELLDKACQGLEIWDEHLERKLKFGHRLVLENRLVNLVNSKFDIIEKTCLEFDKLKDDKHGVDNEREWLRYEIRHCDMGFTEIHEAFLKSYLDMDW